ncbi:MAG TPA: serine hydrolase domain-containing protein [Vicinamibacterales bacterium]|nr:serine hydrolase domain-containing protein [Vicinamibacterales bacterium]
MSMRRPPLLLLALTIVLSVGALVHAADDFVLSRFGEYLDALRIQASIPGLAAAIVGPADVTWEGAFGQQDVEHNVVTRIDTPFELDGTTQAFVASIAMRCASDGLLSLDETVGTFNPASPDAGATIRQLLTHTTAGPKGLTFAYRPERLAPLAAAIARCTDSTFRKAVADRFDQFGMFTSIPGSEVVTLQAPAEGFTASALQRYAGALLRLATPYAVDARGRATASSYVASTLTPASGMISTLGDLEQFDLALKKGVALRPEWRTLAWTPPTDGNGQALPHAYGWFVQTYNGGPIVWQFGVSDNASSSMIISLPQRGVTLILLANSAGLVRPFDLAAGDVTVSPFARLFLSVFVR